MFLDAFGAPKDVTPDNLHEYTYDLHGVMLLTSADYEVYIPPRWHGTVYSTEELLDSYRKRFKPDSTLLTFHALEPYEPELICCERCVVEITVLPAGQTLHTGTEIVVFLVKIYEVNTLITKELGTELNFFPSNHHYHVRIMNEGIDILYVDDKIYSGQVISGVSYQHQCVQNLLKKLQPLGVKSLSGQQLPDQLTNMCRKVDAAPKK
ncbi:uncharacterized protein LOC115758734 [Drosophila novamexicana]|uniref:Uncharacterized protein n=1 Tax=Drosophila virilis TaxID=7244 RepID=B4LT41_DROVI|nr:uncharacterized protein LOC6627626 [Drosophila virilis]XP_030555344.1 uncharacterized protein LOC115758734 [Drosophila novamexicana]EDW63872.1 uncharacterized protein Dvir_GJ10778 [Drosophila virilis]